MLRKNLVYRRHFIMPKAHLENPPATVPATLPPEICPVRELLDRVGDAWSMLAVVHLRTGPCRFNRLRRQIEGITQRMLTVTLRRLERDGLVSRRVIPTAPPQVEYTLSDLGHSLAGVVEALRVWALSNRGAVIDARREFDARTPLKET